MKLNQQQYEIYWRVNKIVTVAINDLYSLPMAVLQGADPSIEDIVNLCKMYVALVEGAGVGHYLSDVIKVMGEAAESIRDNDEKRLTDCAYHLESIMSDIGVIEKEKQ